MWACVRVIVRHVVGSVIALAVSCGAACAQQPAKVGYWIATNDSRVLDEQVLQLVASRAGIVVLNAPLRGPRPQYDFSSLVSRLHALHRPLPVLLYVWPSRWYPGERVGSAWYQEANSNTAYHLRTSAGAPLRAGARGVFLDVTQSAERAWWLSRTAAALAVTGADGVALDLTVRDPKFLPATVSARCRRDPGFCIRYATGVDSILGGLHNLRSQPLIAFNGFWNFRPGMLASQLGLLSHSDISVIEFFGYRSLNGALPWGTGIQPYLNLIAAQPDHRWMVFGRGPSGYSDYLRDFEWQRYLYGSYLLVSGKNTLFKYNTTFQEPVHTGRSGGLDTYGDWDFALGSPAGPYAARDGVYERRFSEGLVVVVPAGHSRVRYILDRTYYTPEGASLSGAASIDPGHALLLLRKPPAVAPIRYGTETWQSLSRSWKAASVLAANDTNYLHLARLSAVDVGEHDLLLQPVKLERNYPDVHMVMRTTDPNARVELVAEVDDAERKQMFVNVVVPPADARSAIPRTARVGWFRSSDIPRMLRQIKAGITLRRGEWQSITLDGEAILSETDRFTFRRWVYMRPIGEVDVASVDVIPR